MLGVAVWAEVITQDGVGTLGGVAALGGIAARGSAAAQGGVSTLGRINARNGDGTCRGVGMWGDARVLCLRASGSSSSSSSSSSVRPVMTLRRFRLLSSSSMIKGPPVPRGAEAFFF
jgi:hypothetical protein